MAPSVVPALAAKNSVRTAFPNIADEDEVKATAKPQAAISSGKADGTAAPASGNEAASAFQISTAAANLHPSLTEEDFMQGNPPVNRSMPRSGADASSRQAKVRSRSEAASQVDSSSAAPEKSTGGGEHDANASLTAEGSAHALSLQATGTTPAAAPAPTPAAADTAQSAAYSTSAQPLHPLQDTAPPPAQPQPQLQSNPLPDTHRVVDSGQLRVSENDSELKISVQLPDLGKIEVRAVTSHDVTTAHLTAFHHDALQVLSADRNGLEAALKSRDVILGTLDSHTQHGSTGQQRQQYSQSSAQSPDGMSSTAARLAASASEEAGSLGVLPDYSSISVRA